MYIKKKILHYIEKDVLMHCATAFSRKRLASSYKLIASNPYMSDENSLKKSFTLFN